MRLGAIEISPWFIVAVALIFYFDSLNLFVFVLVSALFHELGHISAIKLLGRKVVGLKLSLFGAEITEAGGDRLSYIDEIIIFFCGPLANILLAVLFSFAGNYFENNFCLTLAGINLFLGVINLLPLPQLDGGCIAKRIFISLKYRGL